MFEKQDNTVVFSYDRDELLKEACLMSSYKSRVLRDKEGGYAGEELVMTEDESEAFNAFLERAAADVRDVVIKLTYGVEEAFMVEDGSVTVRLRDNGGYNDNALAGVDAGIKEMLLNGVLKEWYGVSGGGDYFREYAERCMASVRVLQNRVFDLRKRMM